MFRRALYFFTFPDFMSLFLFICQTAGKTVASRGSWLLGIIVKFPFSTWSFHSLVMASLNWSASFFHGLVMIHSVNCRWLPCKSLVGPHHTLLHLCQALLQVQIFPVFHRLVDYFEAM